MAKADVELRIRAQDEASKNVAGVAASLEKLTAAQQKLAGTTSKASDGIAAIVAEIAKLGSAGAAGKAFEGIANSIAKVTASVEKQQRGLDETQRELDTYKTALADATAKLEALKKAQDSFVGPQTKEALKAQAKEFRGLQAEVNKNQAAIEKASLSYEKQAASIDESKKALVELNQQQQQAATLMQQVAAVEARAAKLQERRAQLTQQSAAAAKGFAEFAAREAQVIEASANARARRRVALEQEAKAAEQAAAANARLQDEMKRVAAAEQTVRTAGANTSQQQLATATAELKAAYNQLNGELSKVAAKYGAFSKEADALRARQLQLADAIQTGEQAMRAAADTARKDAAAKAEQAAANARLEASSRDLAQAEALLNNPANKASKEQLALAVMVLRNRYSQLNAELNKVQAETGVFSDKAAKLRGEVAKLSQSIKAGETAIADFGQEGQKSFSLFNEGGRTTLSFTQRLRGQILSLAAAYVGLFGAVDLVRGALKQQEQTSGTQARLDVLFNGDAAKSAAELKQVRAAADELGMVYGDLAEQYSKVAVAATTSGASIEQTRTVFFNLAQTSRALGLSTEQNERIFTAIGQIFSKQKITAEELQQQLGDSLPGAVGILAKSMGVTTQELSKMLQEGKVGSEQLIKFSVAAREAFGQGLDKQVNSLAAELNKTKNVLNDMRAAFLEGFGPAFAEALRGFREAFGGNKGLAELARSTGEQLGKLAKAAVAVLDVLVKISPFIATFGAAWAAAKLADVANDIGRLTNNLDRMQGVLDASWEKLTRVGSATATAGDAATATAGKVGRLGAALNVLSVAAGVGGLAYSLGKLVLVFKPVQIAAVGFVQVIEQARIGLGAYGRVAANTLRLVFRQIDLKTFMQDNAIAVDDAMKESGRSLAIFKQQVADIKAGITDLSNPGDDATATFEANHQAWLKMQEEAALKQSEALEKERQKQAAAEASKKASEEAQKALEKERAALEALVRAYESAANKSRDLLDREARFTERFKATLREGAEATAESRLAEVAARVEAFRRESEAIEADLRAQAVKNQQLLNDPRLSQKQRTDLSYQTANLNITADNMAAARPANVNTYQGQLTALADLENAQQEAARLEAERQAAFAEIDRQAAQLGMNEVQVTELKNEAIRETAVGLEQAYLKAAQYADIAGQPAVALQFREQAKAVRDGLVPAFDMMKAVANGAYAALTNGLVQFGQEAVKSFGEALAGMQSWSDALKGVGNAFRSFAAQVLQQIAQLIVQYAILKVIAGGMFGGGMAGYAQGLLGPRMHTGGVVGSSGYGGTPMRMNPLWFASAQRFHSGGLPGLKKDEVPAILQTGEEVLSRNDPRNVLNGGGGGSKPQDIKIINTIESGSVVSQGVATREGEKAILNLVRANKAAFKQALA